MKKFIVVFLIILTLGVFLTSCSHKLIGKLTMMADRNIENKTDYVLLSSYAGGSKKEIRKSKAETIEEALNQTVKSVPGGEFGKNVKIYFVSPRKRYAVECDVWGLSNNQQMKGFKAGDRVQWFSFGVKHTGKITNVVDDVDCMILDDSDGQSKKVKIENMAKIE
jgi:hypothetical protein